MIGSSYLYHTHTTNQDRQSCRLVYTQVLKFGFAGRHSRVCRATSRQSQNIIIIVNIIIIIVMYFSHSKYSTQVRQSDLLVLYTRIQVGLHDKQVGVVYFFLTVQQCFTIHFFCSKIIDIANNSLGFSHIKHST